MSLLIDVVSIIIDLQEGEFHMQGSELSSFHDGRFPIISIAIAFQSGYAKCFYIFANKFSEKSREISAPATSKEHSFPQQYVILIRLIVQHTNAIVKNL